MNVFDCHVNRTPCKGRIEEILSYKEKGIPEYQYRANIYRGLYDNQTTFGVQSDKGTNPNISKFPVVNGSIIVDGTKITKVTDDSVPLIGLNKRYSYKQFK